MYNLHIDKLLELKIKDIRNFNFVSCALYFHKSSIEQIKQLFVYHFKEDKSYCKFLEYNIDFLAYNSLKKDLDYCFTKRWLNRDSKFHLFTQDISNSIKRFFSLTIHMKEEGEDIPFVQEQLKIINSNQRIMKIEGVMGSGKTTVLAKMAAQVASINENNKVLILTYNITLKNFIHDKIRRNKEYFSWNQITIINYHEFMNFMFNNFNIEFNIPDKLSKSDRLEYLEKNYYENLHVFDEIKNKIIKYDAIFIDEIQDYHRIWMDIIKNNFLNSNGK